jgi:excisionase family DNA binding protein
MYVTSKTMAEMLAVQETTVRGWARRKVIPSTLLGSLRRFDPDVVKRALERRKQ